MAMSTEHEKPSVFGCLGRWWRNWIDHREALRELENFSPEELHRMASDAGVNVQDLKAFAAKWPDLANLLSRRLAALNIDPLQVARDYPAVANDLRRLCFQCKATQRCEHDFEWDPKSSAWQDYCPNTNTLNALSGVKRPPAGGSKS